MQKRNRVRILIGLIMAIIGAVVVIALEDVLIVATGLGSLDQQTLQLVESILAIIIGLAITAVVLTIFLFLLIKTVE